MPLNFLGWVFVLLFREEAAFRQEVLALCIAIPAAFLIDVDGMTRLLLILSVPLVMLTELLNSAVEAVVDRIGPEHHELSGRAKDMGSAAVLIAMLMAAAIWAYAIFFA